MTTHKKDHMKVHGVSLHYFDVGQNSDKFYRSFIYAKGSTHTPTWCATFHWGRDGAPNGQTQTLSFPSRAAASAAIERKVNEKIRKGYEFLGQGDIDVPDLVDVHLVGHLLHQRVGRQPTKVAGFSLVIEEEVDLLDLLTN